MSQIPSSRSNKTSQTGLKFSKFLFIWFPISPRANNTIKGMYARHRDNSVELTWNKQQAHKGSCGLTIWKVYLIEILCTKGGHWTKSWKRAITAFIFFRNSIGYFFSFFINKLFNCIDWEISNITRCFGLNSSVAWNFI